MSNSVSMIQPSSDGMQLLFHDIAAIIKQVRQHVRQTVNLAMVQSCWQIDRQIVDHEQQGKTRAAYGKQQIQILSDRLTQEFGKGFDTRNLRLRNMRAFYMCFSIWNAVCTELSWTHYRILIRLENTKARDWYLKETIEQSWSVQTLYLCGREK